TLDVIIGSGQIGSIGVQVGDDPLVMGHDHLKVALGQGFDVKGKTVVVGTAVHDVNPNTNRSEVQYTLTGGFPPDVFHTELVPTEDLLMVIHVATFTFAQVAPCFAMHSQSTSSFSPG